MREHRSWTCVVLCVLFVLAGVALTAAPSEAVSWHTMWKLQPAGVWDDDIDAYRDICGRDDYGDIKGLTYDYYWPISYPGDVEHYSVLQDADGSQGNIQLYGVPADEEHQDAFLAELEIDEEPKDPNAARRRYAVAVLRYASPQSTAWVGLEIWRLSESIDGCNQLPGTGDPNLDEIATYVETWDFVSASTGMNYVQITANPTYGDFDDYYWDDGYGTVLRVAGSKGYTNSNLFLDAIAMNYQEQYP